MGGARLLGLGALLAAACGGMPPATQAPIVAARPPPAPLEACAPVRLVVPTGCAPLTDADAERHAALMPVRHEVYEQARLAESMRASLARAHRESAEDGTPEEPPDEVDAAARCGALPSNASLYQVGGRTESDPPVALIHISIPTDAGGASDQPSWSALVVKVGCEWKRVAVGELVVTGQRTPTGERLWSETVVPGQCESTERLFRIRDGEPEDLGTFSLPRFDDDVCNGPERVDRVTDGDILRGWRRSVRQYDSDAWTPVEEVLWKDSKYVIVGSKH